MTEDDRIWIISHHLCGAQGVCECPGENGADTETAVCWEMARNLVKRCRAEELEELIGALKREAV
jgi:hypothetical protein